MDVRTVAVLGAGTMGHGIAHAANTRLSILQYLHRTLGEKFRPCPLLEQHVRDGRLGRKVGKGVYDY